MDFNCYECSKSVSKIGGDNIRVYVNSPRGIRGAFLVCSKECADKLAFRLIEKGWKVVQPQGVMRQTISR
jgi:hypothetical protein